MADQNVARARNRFTSRRRAKIRHRAALPAQPERARRERAKALAAAWLDLHDVRAEIREHGGTDAADRAAAQVQDANAGEGS